VDEIARSIYFPWQEGAQFTCSSFPQRLTLLFCQVVLECQKRDDYQDAIRWFLDHVKQYIESYGDVTQAGGQYIHGIFLSLHYHWLFKLGIKLEACDGRTLNSP
jgi:hypothetical protein